MKVLGFDPAAHYTGWALIEERTCLDAGLIYGHSGFGNRLAHLIEWQRVQVIARAVVDLVTELEPDVIGYEIQSTKDYRGNVKSFGVYRCAVAAIATAAGLSMPDGCILLATTPWDWKKNKDKQATLMDAQLIFQVPLDYDNPRASDIADAMMIAHHAQTAVKLAKKLEADIASFVKRQYHNTQAWTRAMFALHPGVRQR